MLSVNKFFEEVSYKEIVSFLVEMMSSNFEDFATDQARYKETLSWLEQTLPEGTTSSVEKLVNAIDQQIDSTILFSYFLGLKANLDHFIDPIGRTFLDVDTEVYLREDIARQLPDYQNAQRTQVQFYASLTPVQQERYEGITSANPGSALPKANFPASMNNHCNDIHVRNEQRNHFHNDHRSMA